MKWRFKLDYQPWSDRTRLYIGQIKDQWDRGSSAIVTGITLKTIEGGSYHADDVALGDGGKEFLQAAMDEAWEQGLRPAGFQDFKNELAAVRFHLEDMRLLAKVRKP